MRRSVIALLALGVLVAAAVASAAPAQKKDTSLAVAAYSIPTAVLPKLEAAYSATPAGNGVKFSNSFAASEVQSKAVAAGLPADVVHFSISTDVDRLVSSKLVDKNWGKNKYGGVPEVGRRLRPAERQPQALKSWDDLVKPGVDVVFPNPFSSGGARWDVMAAYGSQLREGKTHKQAVAYLQQLFKHNVSQDTSGRNALNTFLAGRGDVLLDYESDAKLAQSQGKPVYYLIPKATLQIETPVAAVNAGTRPRPRSSSTGSTRRLRRRSGRERLPAVRPECLPKVRQAVPAAAAAFQDRLRRRLEQGEHPVLRSDERHRREDRAVARSLHWRLTPHGCRGRGGAPLALRRSLAGSRWVPQHRRPGPARCTHRERDAGRLASLLAGRVESRGQGCA